ncbi:galactokinase [Shewanella salipaludis]|uniref:Galactokinase n=1 Tax=Shewanella salipaludis TaxID=2723052 RepID=A0A972JL60_9GAMM|nr:galactokinase [Shewanella salipaludis]NMH66920.1 galactokinase [Shewanella salipaludis]
MSNPAQRATKLFVQTFGTKADDFYQAPGRVNLIGEHTDYNDGLVLSAAINFHTVIAVKRRDDDLFRAVAEAFPGTLKQWRFGQEGEMAPDDAWVNYLKGFTSAMALSGLTAKGLDIAIVGNVPLGAGLSSSAALEIAFGTAINDTSQLHLSPLAVAQLAQRGESRYVGQACGIVDQMISALGETDHALLIDCLDLDSEAIAIPEHLSLIVILADPDHGLAESEYRLRRTQCQQVAEHFELDALRHLDSAQLERARDTLEPLLYRRARHVIDENLRSQAAARALEQGNIARLGQLMAESHASMRDNFDISLPQLEQLVETVAAVIGERGGVRLTDAGLGACIIALVDHELTEAVVTAVEQASPGPGGPEATVFLCSASGGAGRVDD